MARKAAVPTEDIPAVTQLFTPHWIVRYLVESSLGRLWLLNRPSSRLRERMPYYIESGGGTDFLQIDTPEEIRLLDPAVGSGHMLTYSFDLLCMIYQEEGYALSDIPGLILTHNLVGVDICSRASQLASLALVMKAREHSRHFFRPDRFVRPRILSMENVVFSEGQLYEYAALLDLGGQLTGPVIKLLNQFGEAAALGSLIRPLLDNKTIAGVRAAIESKDISGQLFLVDTHSKVVRALTQADVLSSQYTVVLTNPPYMGSKGMNARLKAFIGEHFAEHKADLFAAFCVRCLGLTQKDGRLGFMTPFVWMFLSSYSALRSLFLAENSLATLIQPEYHSFFESAYVPICAFTISKNISQSKGVFIRLTEFYGESPQSKKALEAIDNRGVTWRYDVEPTSFLSVPGSPIAYWISPKGRSIFTGTSVKEVLTSDGQILTGNNERFLRYVWEIDSHSVGPTCRWKLHHKGGEFRRWYGNVEWVVAWDERARAFYKADRTARIPKEYLWDLEGITWSTISSSRPSFRKVLKS